MKTLITVVFAFFTFTQPINEERKAQRIEILDKIFTTLEDNIADVRWLEEQSYKDFKSLVYSDSILALNGQDFYTTFNEGRRTLPFSHFELVPKRRQSTNLSDNKEIPASKAIPAVTWEEIDEKTAYLKISTFIISAEPVLKAISEIGEDKYEHLIIDLRNNGGGSVDGPVVLGQFLTQQPIDAGYYLTRKWFENHDDYPTSAQVDQMPFLQDFTFAGIGKMFAQEEAFRMVVPGHNRPVFQGKVYVLIDHWTASACEPLIDLLKKKNIATLVGEKSYGGMLSAKFFDVNDSWKIFIPIADYYTADGTKIDRVGVSPDIEVASSNAKAYVLELIND